MTVAAVILVLLLFVVSVTQNQAAPENPMEKENADPSRMYVTSSSLAMDESLLDSVENANINTGNQENQEEQEEEQQEEQDEENQDEEQQEEQQQEENQEENSDNSTETQEQQTSEEQQQVSQTPLDSNSEQLDSLLPIVKKDKTKIIPVQDHPAVTVKMEEMEIPEIVVREPVAMATEKETATGTARKMENRLW